MTDKVTYLFVGFKAEDMKRVSELAEDPAAFVRKIPCVKSCINSADNRYLIMPKAVATSQEFGFRKEKTNMYNVELSKEQADEWLKVVPDAK